MEQVPIRALNQDTAEVIARVERGEVIEVTNRGRPVARISSRPRWSRWRSARATPQSARRTRILAGVLARLHRVEINALSVRSPAGYPEPAIHSRDAVHLATAELLGASGKPLDAFVTYDKRLAVAAYQAGLPTAAPS